jgi:SCF-associated factor 1
MCNIETEDFGVPTTLNQSAPLKPTIIPSLQYRDIISVVLGDYHYGALTSSGKLLSWGAFSKGALGLGDPVDIEPGQPGGFRTRDEMLAVRDAIYMPFEPPEVREPTEVRFDHMLKSKGKERFVFAAAAAGWHMGALVIDLEVRLVTVLCICTKEAYCLMLAWRGRRGGGVHERHAWCFP